MPRPRSISWQRLAAHLIGLFPLAIILFAAYTDNLTINPIQNLTQRTGRSALVMLLFSLSCTPINTIFHYPPVIKARRTWGLYAFTYAISHFLMFVGVDYAFNLRQISDDLLTKPYVLVGLSALLILLPLAITSFNYWKKKLGKTWKRLHRLVYLAGALVIVHYFWVVKGDLLRLSGDIFLPIAYGAVLCLLLLLRLPPVRRYFASSPIRLRRPARPLPAPPQKTT